MSLRSFDDRDPAIQYVGFWWQSGNAVREREGTTTVTDRAGATARVSFTGTGISVFGTIGNLKGPITNYMIEGSPSSSARYVAQPTDDGQYGVTFYEVRDLTPGPHVLVITVESSEAEYFLDFFNVVGENERPPPPAQSTAGTSNSPIPPPPQSTSIIPPESSSSNPSPTPDANSNSALTSSIGGNTASSQAVIHGSTALIPILASSSSRAPISSAGVDAEPNEAGASSSPPIGPIVGGLLGGLAVLCILVLCIVFYRGKRRRAKDLQVGIESSFRQAPLSTSPVTPFVPQGVYSPLGDGPPSTTHLYPVKKQPLDSHRMAPDQLNLPAHSSPQPSNAALGDVPPPRYEG